MTTLMPAAELELRRALGVPIIDLEVRESGAGKDTWVTIRGHAAVFDRLSHDLGGFRERILPGAFTRVLDANPDVHLVVGHDMNKPLARTLNGTLELREDPHGLHMWARVAVDTTYAKDAVAAMRNGLLDQASFAFTVEDDEWTQERDTGVVRTIRSVAGLYDVSVVAQGAYPQTDSAVARNLYLAAQAAGRLAGGAAPNAAPDDPAGTASIVAPDDPAGDAPTPLAPSVVGPTIDEYRRRANRVRGLLVTDLMKEYQR